MAEIYVPNDKIRLGEVCNAPVTIAIQVWCKTKWFPPLLYS